MRKKNFILFVLPSLSLVSFLLTLGETVVMTLGRWEMNRMKNAFGILQKIGRALMLPVAILPAAGILLAMGDALQNPDLIGNIGILNSTWVQLIASVMQSAGDIVFANLPLLFAVGVAIGLANGDGVAGIAAIIGYLIMNVTMSAVLIANGSIPADTVERAEFFTGNHPAYATMLGIPTLATGVFGGIIVGVLAAIMFNKFYKIELPQYLGFSPVNALSRLSHR